MGDVSDTFANRLLWSRLRRDYTQVDLAKQAEIDQAQISNYEAGRREPNIENLRRIAQALDITADYLLGLTDETRRLG